MKREDSLYWLWLADKFGAGSKLLTVMLNKYGNPFEIYALDEEEIEDIEELSVKQKERLCDKRLDRFYDIIGECIKGDIDIITYEDERYPIALKDLQDPPAVLYCKGELPDFNNRLCIGIVGTRKMSEYGKQTAFRLSYELAAANVLTVSGMAMGIDGVSACGAIRAGGETVAILGCGVDVAYPKVHETLMGQIAEHGAVISEYPPKSEPRKYNFPMRNRIISGLCRGVLVVEAAEKSGALITAKDALVQGRQVFAVPGKISDVGAKGPNDLILQGAYPVLSVFDILKQYDLLYGTQGYKKQLEERCGAMPEADEVMASFGLNYSPKPTAASEAGAANAPEPAKPKEPRQPRQKKQTVQTKVQTQEHTASGSAASQWANVETLDPVVRKIYDSIPKDKPISADRVYNKGISTSEILTSLSMLEIYGLIRSLPGGMYIKN